MHGSLGDHPRGNRLANPGRARSEACPAAPKVGRIRTVSTSIIASDARTQCFLRRVPPGTNVAKPIATNEPTFRANLRAPRYAAVDVGEAGARATGDRDLRIAMISRGEAVDPLTHSPLSPTTTGLSRPICSSSSSPLRGFDGCLSRGLYRPEASSWVADHTANTFYFVATWFDQVAPRTVFPGDRSGRRHLLNDDLGGSYRPIPLDKVVDDCHLDVSARCRLNQELCQRAIIRIDSSSCRTRLLISIAS